jgi:hypothetical protein
VKPPNPDLIRGISPCLILWRGTCPGWLSPSNGDPGCTQILTWHYDAQSQTVSQLVSSRTTPSSKSPQFSPSGLLTRPRMGLVQMSHHNLTTRTELWGCTKVVSIKINSTYQLSLRLCFHLRQTQPRGLHGGHHRGILGRSCGGFGPTNFATESRGSAHSCV